MPWMELWSDKVKPEATGVAQRTRRYPVPVRGSGELPTELQTECWADRKLGNCSGILVFLLITAWVGSQDEETFLHVLQIFLSVFLPLWHLVQLGASVHLPGQPGAEVMRRCSNGTKWYCPEPITVCHLSLTRQVSPELRSHHTGSVCAMVTWVGQALGAPALLGLSLF